MKVSHLEPQGGKHHQSGGSVLPCCSKPLACPNCTGHTSAVVCFAVLCLRFFLLYTAFARGNKIFPQQLEFQHFPQRTLNSCLFWLLTVSVLPLQCPLIPHPWVFLPFSSGNLTWNFFQTCAALNVSISSPVPPSVSSPSFFVGLYSWGVCFSTARSRTSESLFLISASQWNVLHWTVASQQIQPVYKTVWGWGFLRLQNCLFSSLVFSL